jgi:hypothetical protein
MYQWQAISGPQDKYIVLNATELLDRESSALIWFFSAISEGEIATALLPHLFAHPLLWNKVAYRVRPNLVRLGSNVANARLG